MPQKDTTLRQYTEYLFWRNLARSDSATLLLFALATVLLHTFLNNRYGFHRDELLTYTNSRHLAWGYVVYPPITAFLGRVELEIFGASLRGFRLFAAMAQGTAIFFSGFAARELGGRRETQFTAAVATAIGGDSLAHGSFLSYSSFDFPCWILVAYFVIRFLNSQDARWWIAVGAAIGLGMMAKYSMVFLCLGVVGGLFLTPCRRFLKSPWLWCGVATGLVIILPNILWQIEHHFVSLEYLKSIHARDMQRGWTDHFLLNQLWKCANPVTVPLWGAGLWYVFVTPEGKRYRMLGWMYVLPLLAFLIARGRDYYLAPAYPMLLALGAVYGEQWLMSLKPGTAAAIRHNCWTSLTVTGIITCALTLPMAPINSLWWHVANRTSGIFDSEIGWPEMVESVARIRDSLPAQEQSGIGILAGDEGEAGAINLYGPQYGLPPAISGMNSNWERGYGNPAPQIVIVLGERREFVDQNFESCTLSGHVTNRYSIENSSISGYADIFVCRNLRRPWSEFWEHFRYYG
jgi:Dolichyl-phosphate-mannose-protein mannosyltransferase